MLDIGWPELLVIAIVMIVVVGPKDLPRMLRTFGRTTAKLRSMAGDFRKQFDDALKEAELDDIKSLAEDVRSLNPKHAIRKELSSLDKIGRGVEKDLRETARPNSKAAKTGAKASDKPHVMEPLKKAATSKTAGAATDDGDGAAPSEPKVRVYDASSEAPKGKSAEETNTTPADEPKRTGSDG